MRRTSVAKGASVAPLPKGWPEAIADAGLYGLPGEIVAVLSPHTEADPMAILAQLLAAFGSAVGREPHFEVEADRHYSNIFVVLVGESAKGRKGTSWGYVKRLMGFADPQWLAERVQSGLSSGEGLIYAVRDGNAEEDDEDHGRPSQPHDEGVDDKRLLVVESEFASLLKVATRNGNTITANIRNAWDSGALQSLTRKSPLRATGAHISIVGHVTRTELLKDLSETESANGFANRFMFFSVRRTRLLPDGGNLPNEEFERLGARIRTALERAQGVQLLQKDAAAGKLWREVYSQLSSETPGLLGAITARSEPQTLRLAMLYALMDGAREIRIEHLQAGLAVWEYSRQSASFIFGDSLGHVLADEALKHLRDAREGMSRTELRDLFGRHKKGSQLGRALAYLAEQGLARCETQKTAGRPREVWHATTEDGDQSDLSDRRREGHE